ncbi:MAG: hypothetical protein FGM15_12770 [Chthoniobacterales bacterium]|nr:hypothetical protein [Chthoniobacterales bacterium]
MALVITLSMVVLLTFLIVAFFSSATNVRKVENSSAGGVSARLLAEGALGAVQAELLEEIRAGSTSAAAGGTTIYTPKSAINMVPAVAALASGTNFANVVKQSGRQFFTGAKIFNSTGNDSTATAAADGRSVNPSRWSAPMLTGTNFDTNNAPRWIYVNRDGSYTVAASSNTIGRVAFNVYDIGGLLNINASGFAPGTGGTTFSSEAQRKGSAVWADLRALPGINASAFADADAWPPKWRLTGNWGSGAGGFSLLSTAADASGPYYERTGWRTAYLKPAGADSDRMFASRQDLIRYAKAYPGTFTASGSLIPALQYLTTFSRDINAPAFQPDPGRPKVQLDSAGGGNDAKNADNNINPSLLAATKVGGSLAITNRFPLSRLSLVSTPIPPAAPAGDTAKILDYFGLTWDASNNRWTYNHGDPGKIYRLSEVPAARDPDFFELLKAAISVGSLGKQFGADFPAAYIPALPSSRLGGDDGRVEDQVVQIAANIIDQADADSYPTRIQFNGRTFYGIEDLPRIYRGHETSYNRGTMPNFGVRADGDPLLPPTNRAKLYVTMVYPELWNPHQPSPTPGGSVPANFRVVANTFTPIGGQSGYLWNSNNTGIQGGGNAGYFSDFSARTNGPNCSQRFTYTAGEGANSGNANAAITFNLGTGDASFREPRPLSAVGYPPGSNANGSPNNPDMALTALVSPGLPDTVVNIAESAVVNPLHGGNTTAYRRALGFVAYYAPFLNKGWVPPQPPRWLLLMIGLGGPVSMELQYQEDLGGQWWTIDKMDVSYANDLRFVHQQSRVANRADPRSSRWGSLYSMGEGTESADTAYRYHTGQTANPSSGNFPVALGGMPPGWQVPAPGWVGAANGGQLGYLQWNLSGSPLRYADPDGVLRGADSKYSSGTVGLPMITGNNTSRPVVLNRPFRSVAELGNVFRDTPWRSLDFMSPESGDRALLDIFTVSEGPDDGIVAGRVNLNTRQAPVLASLIKEAGLATGANISDSEATAAASKLTDWTASTDPSKGPLRDRSELVGRFVSGTNFKGPLEDMAGQLAAADRPIKTSREAIVRALADAGTTRSWVFLIDIIAQSGKLRPGGSTGADFVVDGGSRIWNSVAIDRFTAEVIQQSNEMIQE